ncbi:MAG TPA: hypothetical protein VMZ00_02235 [Sporichthya sp.]|nr:hypothetical protein [Sporichthya sp.]
MTVPEQQVQALVAAAKETLDDVGDGLWLTLQQRGIREGSGQELHVSFRCPSVAAAEELEAALRDKGSTVGAAQPNAEAGGRGYGVAATVPFLASREHLDDVLDRMMRLGAGYGATLAGVGTTFV